MATKRTEQRKKNKHLLALATNGFVKINGTTYVTAIKFSELAKVTDPEKLKRCKIVYSNQTDHNIAEYVLTNMLATNYSANKLLSIDEYIKLSDN